MKFVLFVFLFYFTQTYPQVIQYLGLPDLHITSLKTGYGVIAVGTNHNGVYWQPLDASSENNWNKIQLDSVTVNSVYPHKSGPLGWAIGIGANLDSLNKELIYCSFLGQTTRKLDYGIDTNETKFISAIDGFPDPTICGETFAIGDRNLYRRLFTDTVWHKVRGLTIEGNYASLKAREEFGIVYAGGGEGFAGILLSRSTDKGENWEELFPLCYAAEIDFWDSTIFVTDHSRIMRSTDNGITWDKVFETDTLMIQKLAFSNDGKLFSFTVNSLWYNIPRAYFYYSTDAGNSWNNFQLPFYDLVCGMDAGQDNQFYIAAINKGIFKLTIPLSDAEQVDEITPGEFMLYNNYPNPFNSSTKIKYSIPYSSFITLKLYDVLGEETAILVNGYKTSGVYEMNFEAGDLISGIYFLTLQSGYFSSTKKMVIIK